MCGSEKKRPCCCSEGKRKRVKHGRMPLPDLNYPPPSSSSSSSPSPSSSSSYNYDKVPHWSLQICICFIIYKLLCETNLLYHLQLQLLGISCSSSSEDKKKRVKHGKRPLPVLNYPPPPHHYQPSSPSLPSSSRPQHFDKVPHFSLKYMPFFIIYKLLCETNLIISASAYGECPWTHSCCCL